MHEQTAYTVTLIRPYSIYVSIPLFPTYDIFTPADTVRFGEVVTAPPKLSAKPRRKSDKAQVTLPSDKSDKPEQGPAVIVGLKRKQDIEEERERLIQRYRMAKKAKAERTKQQ